MFFSGYNTPIIFELTFWHIAHILTVAKECGEIPQRACRGRTPCRENKETKFALKVF